MSRFEYHPHTERVLAQQPGMLRSLGKITKRAENEAVRAATPISRRLTDGIDSTVGIDEHGPVGRVNAHWWGSLFVEFGTKDQPARPVLRRALDSIRGTR